MRVDKKKNISKVVKERIKNPLQTTREIAEKVGLDHGTVAKLDKEIPQIATKDDRIVGICDDDLKITILTQKKIIQKIENPEEKVTMLELIKAGEISSKRYSLFIGDATDEKGGSKLPDVYFQIINPNDGE